MKRILGSKALSATVIVLMLLILGFAVAQSVHYFFKAPYTERFSVMLEGEYSVDGGEWKKLDPKAPINDFFHKITFRGTPVAEALAYNNMTISSENVWYTLSADDMVLLEHRYIDYEIEETDPAPSEVMTKTPGYWIATDDFYAYPEEILNGEKKLTLEVEYPYEMATQSFSDCFSVSLSVTDSVYWLFFFEVLPPVLLFVLVCFFGLFFFPVSGFILGRVNYRYLAFGVLCFFWGLYMIIQNISGYLNLWIMDPVVCMMVVKLTGYLFITSVFLYLKSNMQKPLTRAIGNITTLLFFLSAVSALVLHLTNTADLVATSPSIFVIIAVCAVVMIVLLCIEMRGNRNALVFLISWTPLILTLALDIVDQFVHLPGSRFFNYGLMITMAYQIVRLILDLRTQYKETIRYQQMQKELYEAKVSVMVSQIQPHFMYNALSSIAMMCTLNPETAQEATITFADYLRGNMDSLKQTAPVPFETELEHLKKYLYIEKLRFADLLNVEYDIQATDFKLPLLSIQPLVENAVKHGVGMAEDGGTVKISTRKTENAYEVIVEDDGVGFDVNEKKDDGRSHVGMENTKKRLHDMCGGEVIITSEIGKGTKAKVILPKEGQIDENTVR